MGSAQVRRFFACAGGFGWDILAHFCPACPTCARARRILERPFIKRVIGRRRICCTFFWGEAFCGCGFWGRLRPGRPLAWAFGLGIINGKWAGKRIGKWNFIHGGKVRLPFAGRRPAPRFFRGALQPVPAQKFVDSFGGATLNFCQCDFFSVMRIF